MQLPVDIKALLDEVTSIKDAKETPISVSVYIDEEAPADLVAHVRGGFASTLPTVRMTVSYLGANFAPSSADDIAVIVAGTSEEIGRYAYDVREVGVPVMVVTTLPAKVAMIADASGFAIPDGDLVYPLLDKEVKDEDAVVYEDAENGEVALDEPVPVAAESDEALNLDERMGRWIVTVCKEKRLAYAIAFPFVRRPLAKDLVMQTSLQNAGVGIIPIPGADLPIMTLNQAKMVLQIAAAYGQDMSKARLVEMGAVCGSAYVCRTLTRELLGLLPGLGIIIKPGVAFGGTQALGLAVIEYFEGGQNVSGVANVVQKASDLGVKAAAIAAPKIRALKSLIS